MIVFEYVLNRQCTSLFERAKNTTCDANENYSNRENEIFEWKWHEQWVKRHDSENSCCTTKSRLENSKDIVKVCVEDVCQNSQRQSDQERKFIKDQKFKIKKLSWHDWSLKVKFDRRRRFCFKHHHARCEATRSTWFQSYEVSKVKANQEHRENKRRSWEAWQISKNAIFDQKCNRCESDNTRRFENENWN